MLKIYKNLKPHTIFIILIVLLQFLQAMANLYLPTLMSDITNNGILKSDVDYIWKIGGLMLLVSAGGAVCAIVAFLFSSRTGAKLGYTLRSKIFTHIEDFSLNEFDKFGASTLITRTTNDITQIQQTTVMIFNMMISAPITLVAGSILAYREDAGLTPVIIVAIPVILIVVGIIGVKGIPLFRQIQSKIDRLNLVLREKLTGIRVVRAFDQIEHEKARFDVASRDLTDTYIKVNRIMAVAMPAMMLIMNLVTLAILVLGAYRISDDTSNIGSLMAFMQYAMQILMSLLMATMMIIIIPRAQAAAVRYNEVLETIPEIVDPKDGQHSGGKSGYIEFKNVSFSYHGAELPAITNISFSAKPGETTAIIGGTGSGKSTIVNLIPRFYDTDKGEVLIDGINVKNYTQHELRSKIGFVPQKAILFTGTITDNMKYGKNDASNEEVEAAATTAQAADFISRMPEQYDTVLSEGGLNLSGGQKQRLSIARALIRKPEIYVFDDSFSALDFKTDANLRAALKSETQNSTVIIVAQRVGTVMDADRIIVLNDGEVTGIGTHSELLERCEVYKEIVSSQLSQEEIA